MACTAPAWACVVRKQWLAFVRWVYPPSSSRGSRQTRTAPSAPPVINFCPSDIRAAHSTAPSWPRSRRTGPSGTLRKPTPSNPRLRAASFKPAMRTLRHPCSAVSFLSSISCHRSFVGFGPGACVSAAACSSASRSRRARIFARSIVSAGPRPSLPETHDAHASSRDQEWGTNFRRLVR